MVALVSEGGKASKGTPAYDATKLMDEIEAIEVSSAGAGEDSRAHAGAKRRRGVEPAKAVATGGTAKKRRRG